MVLGFGCGTMATMSTRILSSKRERLIAPRLRHWGFPGSVNSEVMLGIAAGFSQKATLTVIGVVASQLLLVAFLLPGSFMVAPASLFSNPPIRIPQFKNVALKTWYRVQWYLKEAVPLFLAGTLFLFVLDAVHVQERTLLEWVQIGMAPLLSGLLHLPAEAAGIFLLGFLRRDYGRQGFMIWQGRASWKWTTGLFVSLVVITLFVPCIASFS